MSASAIGSRSGLGSGHPGRPACPFAWGGPL